MPFIVQCPHADCRKFMLLEDSHRGSTVDCLLCQKPIKVESWSSATAATGNAPPNLASRLASTNADVRPCPHCGASLRLPAAKATSIKCPKCAHVFKA